MTIPKIRFYEFFDKYEKRELISECSIYDGTHATPNYVEEGVPFYSVEQVTSNNFNDTKFISEKVFEKECKRVSLERGDVLMTRIGDVGSSRYIDWDVRASFYVSLALIKPKGRIDGEYISHYMSSPYFQRELYKRMIHVAFPKKINLGEIGKCKICFPSEVEQRKVADFLSTLDKKINLLKEKHALLIQYKKGVMQKLFKREIRFKDADGGEYSDWQEYRLSDVLELTLNPIKMADESDYELITVRRRNGGVDSRGLYKGKEVLVKSQFALKKNQFVISKRQIVHGACGIVPSILEGAIVSNEYNVFDVVPDLLDVHFFNLFSQTKYMRRTYFINSDGVHIEKLLFKTQSWLKTKVTIPSLSEQKKIVAFVETLDAKIVAINKQIELTQTFKNGLLQQMFV